MNIKSLNRLGTERKIVSPIDGWNPPDTKELTELNKTLDYVGRRIHTLRIAVLLNAQDEKVKIHRIMTSRERELEKSFKRGLRAGKRRRKYRIKTEKTFHLFDVSSTGLQDMFELVEKKLPKKGGE